LVLNKHLQEHSGLVLVGLSAGYGRRNVISDIELHVNPGEVVGLFGHNGAGKTTTLRAITGLLPVSAGEVSISGKNVTKANAAVVHAAGSAYVPAQDFVFGPLSVADNLKLGIPRGTSEQEIEERRAFVERLFPILSERQSQLASTMSGGQQRMLSLGIALMSAPTVLLLDEPSLGLSPALTDTLMETVRYLADERGTAVLLLEQNIIAAARVTDRAYSMRSGRISGEISGDDLRSRDSFWDIT